MTTWIIYLYLFDWKRPFTNRSYRSNR